MTKDLLPPGRARAIDKRNLTEETCKRWGYTVGEMGGEAVTIANYRDASGSIVAQKVRTRDKDFKFLGNTKEAGLYGQHLWRDGGRKVVITEGELDAMSVSQIQGHKWPVVSLPGGAAGAKRSKILPAAFSVTIRAAAPHMPKALTGLSPLHSEGVAGAR